MNMATTYQGSHQEYDVICQRDVMIPMRDGVNLATDIYFPATGGQRAEGRFPILLERTPYNKASPTPARRGYVCAFQDVLGRVAS